MSVTSQLDISAEPAAVWAVLTDLAGLGSWQTNHLGFTGPAPEALRAGVEYTERLSVLGMPNEVRWTVTEVEEGHRVVQKGKGPMGISIDGEYMVRPEGDGTRVTLTQSFSGATVFAIKGQLEREVQKIQQDSLRKLAGLLTPA